MVLARHMCASTLVALTCCVMLGLACALAAYAACCSMGGLISGMASGTELRSLQRHRL
jgi:hydrogenase/urease accessory protein HupE